MRYVEISRMLAGISQKMLTQTLRSLERDGLVTRTVTPTVPVTVSYELTALGLSLYDMTRASGNGRRTTWPMSSPTANTSTQTQPPNACAVFDWKRLRRI
jgi:DNA-binding HxlR family transcriptional regulator